MFSHTNRRATTGEGGGFTCFFSKIEKGDDFGKKEALIVSIFGLNFLFKM